MATEKKQILLACISFFSLVLVTYLWLFRIIFHILFFFNLPQVVEFHYSHRSCFQRRAFILVGIFSFLFIFY